MDVFPNLDLIGQPDYHEALRGLAPNAAAGVDLLVIYDGALDFLTRVLNAAGYDDPPLQARLLEWTPKKGGIDLAGLVRHLGIKRVLLFGQDAAALGLHFQVVDYFPVEVSGVTYLRAPSAGQIAEAKANGDNGPAGALWRGVKAGYVRERLVL